MDILPNLLHVVVLSISFCLVFLIFRQKSSHSKLPPGKKGWPIIGETLEFGTAGQRGTPEMFIKERMIKYSQDLFQTSLFGENLAVLCGASGNKFLFSNEKKYVTAWWPRCIQKVLFESEESYDNNDSTKLRSLVVEFLKPEALQHFIPIMDSMAKEHLETDWRPYKQVKILSLSLKYTFALACRLFISVTDPNHVTTFSDPFNLVKAGTVSVPINIPGTAYNRALKGGKVIRQEILALIKERKKVLAENKGTVAHDLLTHTLLASDENGRALDEMTIAGNILGLLIASHDTTSSAITSVLKYLAEFPHVYNLVLQEQMEIARSKGPKDFLNWDDIKKMKYSWNVACESMRLLSPAQGAFREVIHDFTYKGFTIPKGWKTFWTVHSTHKNPEYFPDPEKFDPSRFEGNGPAPYTFVPFGGGPRMCAGRECARLQTLVYMHNVVTRFKWEKAIPDEKITYQLSSIPVNGMEEVLGSYVFGKKKATEVAHLVWKHVVQKGDTVIDATCGNGYDTLAMVKMVADESARGCVYAMDIQNDALENASSLLEESLNPNEKELVKLLPMCHSKMDKVVPEASVRLVAFNLGYLPGGDKTIITKPETTLLALEAAKGILMPGGLISLVVYVGHPGGWAESETVHTFASKLPVNNWACCKFQMLNRPWAPILVLLFKR